ncbi:MAG: twin transmembrane helix small protein [Rhizobiales bacterium]|nr:twin transmembrane helix small protein [Hyphomicrobiales bacterium]
MTFTSLISFAVVAAVAVVLVLGLANMMRGGSPNRSQNFMRWRVLLQFGAIIVLMLALWLSQRGA